MLRINTLKALSDQGYKIDAHCEALNCRRTVSLDLKALLGVLGPDFEVFGDPNPLAAKLRCQTCGGRAISLTITPPSTYQKAKFIG